VAALREAARGENLQAIQRASEELQKLSHGIAEQLYKQAEANAQHAHGQKNDDVREGEVVDA
jgi:hypothetical protein